MPSRLAIKDSLAIGIAAVDLKGRHIYANRAFREMVGMSEAELDGIMPPFAFWPPEERRSNAEAFRKMMRRAAPPEGFEVRLLHGNGERFDAHVLVRPLFEAGGRQAGWVVSVEDVSRRKREEEKLRQTEVRLRTLASRLLTMGERERRMVSRGLNEGVGQILTAVKYGLEQSLRSLGKANGDLELRRMLEESVARLALAIGDVRDMAGGLRPALLDDLGLVAAARRLCRDFGKKHPGTSLRTRLRLEESARVSPSLGGCVYRIMQESLERASRCRSDGVRLSLSGREGRLELTVRSVGDLDGAGGAPREAWMAGLTERARLSGGILNVSRGDGGGTAIRIVWNREERPG